MDTYIKLAKKSVETFVKNGKTIILPDNFPAKFYKMRAGVFVSVYTKEHKYEHKLPRTISPRLKSPSIFDGLAREELRGLPRRLALATRGRRPREQVRVLRGCIGTYLPTCENIGKEIVKNAIDAATSDPRFPLISKEELPHLVYSVDILSEPKPATEKDLDPKKYGIIVKSADGRRGLLLPDLEGVDTVGQQIAICRQKAWISEDEPITLYRFTVERHGEK